MKMMLTYIFFLFSLRTVGISQTQEKKLHLSESTKDEFSAIETITRSELRDHIFYLSSDFLEGRLPGSNGFKQASCYIASQLIEARLVPFINDPEGKKSYFQEMEFTISKIAPQSTLQVWDGQEETVWNIGEHFIPLVHNQAFENGHYEGKAVFAGYGIDEPDYGWSDFENRDVAGKIVIIYIGTPSIDGKPVLPEDKNSFYADMMQSLFDRLQSSFSRKASGVIIIPDAQTSQAWEIIDDKLNKFSRRLKANSGNSGKAQYSVFLLNPIVAADLFRQTAFNPVTGAGDVKSTHIGDVSFTFDLKYEIDSEFVCRNVIGFIPGSDSRLKDEYIVLGAHLDHLGIQEDEVFNGANDNASGCAAILEVAEAIAGLPSKRSIIVIFYTGEEGAGHGSFYFLNHAPIPLSKIKLAINADMLGRNSPEHPDAVLGITADNLARRLAPFIEEANRSVSNISLKTILSGDNFGDYFGASDEAMYSFRGIPTILVTTGFGWPDYHRPTDDASKIEYDRVCDAARLIFALVTTAANNKSIY